MFFGSLLLLAQHLYFGNVPVTFALAISMVTFATTVIRVEFGIYILIVAMLLSPEIDAGYEYSGERALNLRYDDILIIIIFLGVMTKLAFDGRLALWAPSPVNWPIVFFYGICVISSILALERNLGAWDRRTAFFTLLKMLEFYLVFFLVGNAVQGSIALRKQLTVFFAVTMVVSAYAIYTIGVEPRVSAPFEKGGTEPNTLGGYLLLCMCVLAGLFLHAPAWRHRLLFLGLFLISFIPLLYTLSRASYMALAVGMVIIALASRRFVFLGGLMVAFLCLTVVAPGAVRERIAYTFQEEHGEQVVVAGKPLPVKVDKSTNERIIVWTKVYYILFQTNAILFLFGGGVSWESVLDSQYARVFLETGMLGFCAFIFLQYRLLRNAREAYRWTEDWASRGLAIGMFAATFALIVHSFGTISFLIVRIMGPYWFLMALCVCIRNEAIETHTRRLFARQRPAVEAPVPSPAPASTPQTPAVAATSR